MSTSSSSSSSHPPPRRPGGARSMAPRLHIPPTNVPGGHVDQAGEVGWVDARGSPLPPAAHQQQMQAQPSSSSLPLAALAHHGSPSASLGSPAPMRPSRPVLASPLPSSLGRESVPGASAVHSGTSTPAASLLGRPVRPVLASPVPSSSSLRPSRPILASPFASSAGPSNSASSSPAPSRPTRPVLASPLPSTASVPSSLRPSLGPGINVHPPATSNTLPPPSAPLPARSSSRPALSLQVTPSSSPSPAPAPSFLPHTASSSVSASSLLAYDRDEPEDLTVRPYRDAPDAGAYSAFGAPGLNAFHSLSSSSSAPAHDRTLLPQSGAWQATSGQSLVDDLRVAVSRASLASSGSTTPRRGPSPTPGSQAAAAGTPLAKTSSLGYQTHHPPSSAASSTSSTVSSLSAGGEGNCAHQQVDQAVEVEPLAFDPSELEDIGYLGEGAGGAVTLVRSRKTGRVMAKKVITTSPSPEIHRQILRELSFLSTCHHPSIVQHFGSFLFDADSQLALLMEYCEGRSLDAVVKQLREKPERGRSSELVLGKIAVGVLSGLDYLHERRIIHRDIKPSNILVTRDGQFKICDFGVSGELVGSLAGTFTGTSFYMAPERILGQEYTIKSDVWSLGLSLLEVAQNRFPFPPEGEPPIVGQFDLLNFIVNQEPPGLKDDELVVWGEGVKEVVRLCLTRDANARPYPRDLLKHPFIRKSAKRKTPIAKWVAHVWGWDAADGAGPSEANGLA